MAKSQSIKIQEGDTVVELTGSNLETFETDRKLIHDNKLLLEAEQLAKQELRTNAITKLGQASGLTPEEINAILGL